MYKYLKIFYLKFFNYFENCILYFFFSLPFIKREEPSRRRPHSITTTTTTHRTSIYTHTLYDYITTHHLSQNNFLHIYSKLYNVCFIYTQVRANISRSEMDWRYFAKKKIQSKKNSIYFRFRHDYIYQE